MRRRLQIGLAGIALMLGLCGAVQAHPLPGPTSMSPGLVDYLAFQQSSPSGQNVWLGRARALGARWVRLNVYWSSVAPIALPSGFQASDPAASGYRWSALDGAVKAATGHGLRVLLVVLQAPRWAEGPNVPSYAAPGSWEPSPVALAAFAHAIAVRYSGGFTDPAQPGRRLPLVSHFQAWNEPNLPLYLLPQWVQQSDGSIVPESPVLFRSLLNSFYAAVKAVQPRAFVLAGGTGPYGDPTGVNRMAPLVFLRALFCLTPQLGSTPCPDPPHFDALDHHPYALSPTAKAVKPDDVSVPDLGRILRVLHAAQRVGHVRPAGPKPLWLTEFSWPSTPPSSVGLSLAQQARYTSLDFYEFWSQGVSHVFWDQLSDPPPSAESFTIGTGLYFGNGVAKPAAAAYRFPFVALPGPQHGKLLILWGRAPAAGTVKIEKQVGRGWRSILSLRSSAGGVFYITRRLSSRLVLRARIGAATSLGFSTRG